MLHCQGVKVVQLFMKVPLLFCLQFEGRKYCEHDFQMLFAPCCGECGKWQISTPGLNNCRAVQTSQHCWDIQPWAGVVGLVLRSQELWVRTKHDTSRILGYSGCGKFGVFFKVRL